ncbi:MAG: 50S ribosomal protein L10 [Ruminococcus sp.]|nr:50S ribosomal protein L10 [Ruminococcus sp.]
MPSEKVLEAKKALVAELAERLKASVSGIVVNYEGINVADDTAMRKELRECDVKYTVVKNTMLGRACEAAGLAGLEEVLSGTTAIATSETDYAGAARILSKYAKSHEGFAIKSGFLDGEVIDMDKIDALSKLPTREVLLANVLGAFQAPIASFARGVQAIVDKGGVEACLADKDSAEAPAEEAEAPAEETAE